MWFPDDKEKTSKKYFSSKTPFYCICCNHPEHFEIEHSTFQHTLFYSILLYSILLQSFIEMQDLFFFFSI